MVVGIQGGSKLAITRTYKTERECAQCWLTEDWDHIPMRLIENQGDFYESWDFVGMEADEDGEEVYGHVDIPMWGTAFAPCQLDLEWMEEHSREVAELGFTLIFENGSLFALGIDGAGYDFYEHHWIPLYRLRGLQWHDQEGGE